MDSSASQTDAPNGYNRLVLETSPYLLQHAGNPVDWYPWGQEAFDTAAREDKPIFLSIGYSTCHWCHVMEKESFEDERVAAAMNETFVSVKVDREERPDIDSVYMTVCQMMTGGGGWPLTILMTADKRPFFAATYIPRESRFGRIGMLDLVAQVRDIWATRRTEINDTASQLVASLRQLSVKSRGKSPGRPVLDAAYRQLAGRFDSRHGGFGDAPKFPSAHHLMFLLRYWKSSGETAALDMVERTLAAMRLGGIYDQVGFGFHRYSTDARWLVPHFEKMLYDQALLAMAYTEAFQATGKSKYRETACQVLSYVSRDMTDSEGGFFSAEDADSEGEEGKFYIWTEDEVRQLLDPEEAKLAIEVFNVRAAGNFREETSGLATGQNILHMDGPAAAPGYGHGMSPKEAGHEIEAIRQKLLEARRMRVHPSKDDKVLADWNGLMIAALSRAAQAFDDGQYAASARKAADFFLDSMREADGRLLHRYRDGHAGLQANLDDYAFMVWGLIDLYEAVLDVTYLRAALDLTHHMLEHFWDDAEGGFFFTPDYGEDLLVRQKEATDGAIPSGNSAAMLDLLRLAGMTGKAEFEARAHQLSRAFAQRVERVPLGHTFLLSALDFALGPSREVVIVGNPAGSDTMEMLRALRRRFLPNKVILFKPAGEASPELLGVAPFLVDMTAVGDVATAYVCRGQRCELPTTQVDRMIDMLETD